jgi:hypothetical protein
MVVVATCQYEWIRVPVFCRVSHNLTVASPEQDAIIFGVWGEYNAA